MSSNSVMAPAYLGRGHSVTASFAPQRSERVDVRGAKRRHPVRDERREPDDNRHAGERPDVVRAHAVQQPGHQSRRSNSAEESDQEPRGGDDHSLPNDHTDDLPGPCAEGEANANLAGPLGDEVRGYAIDA